jgi:hypothetical protein
MVDLDSDLMNPTEVSLKTLSCAIWQVRDKGIIMIP